MNKHLQQSYHQTATPIWTLHKGELDLFFLLSLTGSILSETQLKNNCLTHKEKLKEWISLTTDMIRDNKLHNSGHI